MEKEQVVELLNQLQNEGWIKIINYSPLELVLRKKLEKEVELNLNFIQEWSSLWQGKYSGIKPHGYYLAQPVSANNERMKKFQKEHPEFSEEIIMEATKRYLYNKSLVNYQYAKKSTKFIIDTQGSELYSWCLGLSSKDELELKEKVEGI